MGIALIRKVLGMAGLAALLFSAPVSAASRQAREHYDAELVVENPKPSAEGKISVALHITPKKGWHIYWSNPGESGYAPTIAWTMPTGFSAGELRHPVPMRLVAGGITSFVHEGDTILLQDISVPRGMAEGTPVSLVADVDLLICSEGTCVPDPVTLDTNLAIGTGAANPAAADLFARARAALPTELAGEARYVAGKDGLGIFLPGLSAAHADGAELFLEQSEVVPSSAALGISEAEGGIIARLPAGSEPAEGVQNGVLVMGGKAYQFHAAKADALPEAASAGIFSGFDTGFLFAFGMAVLGGLLLNLMPCVFPILSLKALALVKYGESERQARAEALGYSLGTIGTVAALGAILLLLRSGGAAVGWAFQLQNPVVVGALLLLVVAIATNLAGLFELPSPSVSSGHKSGFVGSAGTGALAAFIATPCTGPFMAGALGAALVMPPLPALLVMSGLGVGMALPFFCIGFFKPVRQWMPRPGNWMVTLRRVLSIPMFATAVGLAWIMGQLGGVSAMAIGIAAATLLGLGLWWYGMRQHGGKTGVPAFAVVASALAMVVFGIVPTTVEAQPQALSDELGSEPFSEARLTELRNEGKPVFVYLTADWCLTCKVNEATSLSADSVAGAFKTGGVHVLRGDWTRQDPAISAFLKAHGRAGVPLYLWYPADGSKEQELPQVLTPGLLRETALSAS